MPPRRHPRSWLAGRLRSAAGAVQRLAGRVEPTGHFPQRPPSDAPAAAPRRFGEPPRHWLDLVAAHAPGLLRDLDLDASPTDAGQIRGHDDQEDDPATAAVAPAPPDGPIRWADGPTRWDTADRGGTPAGEGTRRFAGTDGFRAGGTGGGFGDTAGTSRTDAVTQADARGDRGLWAPGTPGSFGVPGGTAMAGGVEPVYGTGRAGSHATVGDLGTAGGHGTAGQHGTGATATGVDGRAIDIDGRATGVGGPRTADRDGRSGGSRSAGGTADGATDGMASGSGGGVGGASDATETPGGPGGDAPFAPSDRRMPGRMWDGWRLASPFSRGPATASARAFGPVPRSDTPAVRGDGLSRAVDRPLAHGEFLDNLDPSSPTSTADGTGRGGLAAVEAADNGPWPALPGERTWPEQHTGSRPGQHRDQHAGHPGRWCDGDVATVGAGIGWPTRDPGGGGWPVSSAFGPTARTTDPWPALPDDRTLWTVPGDALDAAQLGRLDREQAGD
ncbi:hypothetical protein HNR22_001038 [Micromonospora jinlongensis]|uniref:Uncharacterized protein n=1 Tax=Micromonospora jinlongensis TaxID=1287877 RepID=A0A7Y9WXD8_9ACTN|nr:hypothetical protein [Micromonospora jinlongensis]NYH41311.1 hypothetical protein [Micromonospora jinlongensis]